MGPGRGDVGCLNGCRGVGGLNGSRDVGGLGRGGSRGLNIDVVYSGVCGSRVQGSGFRA